MPSWIKIRADLESDPRVHRMAALIAKSAPGYILTSQAKDLFGSVTDTVTRNALRDVTVMGLSRVWFAANDHTTDGVFRHADLSYLDSLALITGFGEAMKAVGYAVHDGVNHTVTLPRFEEYNAPDKNGERSKTAAARRQQRLRDKKKAAAEQLQEPSPTTVNEVNPVNKTRDAITSRVTPSITSRHEENNVTPSLSDSCSISDSESKTSDSEPKQNVTPSRGEVLGVTLPALDQPDHIRLDAYERLVNALRRPWGKGKHWNAEEKAALFDALPNLDDLNPQDWLLLHWFFRWAASSANTAQREPMKITDRKHHFLHELNAYFTRATNTWRQAGAPKLGPPTVQPRQPPSTTVNAAPQPPPPNENAFLGLLAGHGGKLPPSNVTTKPAAA